MSYASTRAVLPKGLSFPLKRSALDTALIAAGLADAIHHVYFAQPQRAGLILRLDYCGEGQAGWYAAGRSGLWVFGVASGERRRVEDAFIAHGLRVVIDWLKALKSSGNVIRGTNQLLELSYSEGTLTIATSAQHLLTPASTRRPSAAGDTGR